MESARAWPRPSPTARPRCHTITLSHIDTGTTSADATDFYTCTARTFTAAVTAFTAALSTDIYSAACPSSAADPQTGYTAKHTATTTLASDVSTTAADAAAGNSNTSFHTASTAAALAAATANTNTSANTAAAAHTASQQISQQQMSQSLTSSQLHVMSPPMTTPDIRRQGSPHLTSTPTGFTLSPPTNPASVDSQYFSNIPNTSQDVRFGAINTPQFQPVEETSTTQPDQPASTYQH